MPSFDDKTEAQKGLQEMWENDTSSLTNGRVVLAQIYEVNAEKRTASIKTFGSDPVVSNSDWTGVQWLDLYSCIDGDEISFIPRINSLCLVIFADNMPWIVGFVKPMSIDSDDEPEDLEGEGITENEVAGAANANREKINPGDLILRTIGNARFVMRAGGEIELESTKVCKRLMLPSRNLFSDICRNYEFRTDGGTIDWIDHPEDRQKTIFEQMWRDDLKSTNVIIDTRGTVERGSDVIRRYEIKPGTPNNLGGATIEEPEDSPYLSETYNTGKNELKINGLVYTTVIEEDGDCTKGIGNYRYYCNIRPTGEQTVVINNNYHLNIDPTGELSLNIGIEKEHVEKEIPEGGEGKYSLNIKPTGTTHLNINKKIDLKMDQGGEVVLDVGPGKSTITITPDGTVKVDASSKVELNAPEIDLNADSKIGMVSPLISMNGQASGIITANGTQNVVDFITGVPVIPSTTIFGDV
jgi:hypothetical protein